MSDALTELAHRLWSDDPGAAGTLLNAALAPAEAAYRAGTVLRNAAFDRGLLDVERAPVPVVSVGNIAVGGTGKTPFAHWAALRLRALGEAPAILHGGYGRDEPELHRRWSRDIPVHVNRSRITAARAAAAGGATILVLDDGFQHRALHRDLDIVLLSAERWPMRTRVLPRGPWRETRAALGRADLLVCTRKTAGAQEAAAAAREMSRTSGRPTAVAHLRAGRWTCNGTDVGAPAGPALLVAALAEPRMFAEAARMAGADVASSMTFPDHHAYTAQDARNIRAEARGRPIVTTEKDWTKLDRWLDPAETWLLCQDVLIEAGTDLIDSALERARA